MDTKHDEDEFLGLLGPFEDDAPQVEQSERTALDPAERQALLQGLRQQSSKQREEKRLDEMALNLFRRMKAHRLDPVQWLRLSREERMRAVDAASGERFEAWCAERGATPKEMGERLLSDEELHPVNEIDNATDDLMKVLSRFRRLGLSLSATAKWIQFHADLRWRYGVDDKRSELPTLMRFLERWWSGHSGLRSADCSADTYRKRRSDFNTRIRALRDVVGNDWPDFAIGKLSLALDLVREINGSASRQPGDAESALELLCELMGVDVDPRPPP